MGVDVELERVGRGVGAARALVVEDVDLTAGPDDDQIDGAAQNDLPRVAGFDVEHERFFAGESRSGRGSLAGVGAAEETRHPGDHLGVAWMIRRDALGSEETTELHPRRLELVTGDAEVGRIDPLEEPVRERALRAGVEPGQRTFRRHGRRRAGEGRQIRLGKVEHVDELEAAAAARKVLERGRRNGQASPGRDRAHRRRARESVAGRARRKQRGGRRRVDRDVLDEERGGWRGGVLGEARDHAERAVRLLRRRAYQEHSLRARVTATYASRCCSASSRR